ncbi:MAG: HD domain-containing protein [Planctomycetes bacterium]|nr:HD domain-containing protein [Planctomycetota bacterium]
MSRQSNIFEILIENVSTPILLLNKQLTIKFANKEAASLLNLDGTSLQNCTFIDFLHKGSFHLASRICDEGWQGFSTNHSRINLKTRDGKIRKTIISCVPIKLNGSIEFLQLNIADTTEMENIDQLRRKYFKRLEQEIENKEQQGKEMLRASILAIAALAESIDSYTYAHLERIRYYSRLIAFSLKETDKYKEIITDEYIDLLFELSPLHDIGKVGISDLILQKKGKLSEEDMSEMREHANIGGNALKMAGQYSKRPQAFAIAEMIARFHHQRWDGTGYPDVEINGEQRPLKGEEIPLCARIVTLADVYDALTSERSYKKPYPYDIAKKMILQDSTKHFDPEAVQAFFRKEKEILEVRKMFPDKPNEKNITEFDKNEFKLAERDSMYTTVLLNEKKED